MDGGLGCLSGRTFAIRTDIIQNNDFIEKFRHEKWLGVLPLVAADDDNFVTRYLVNNGWRIGIQSAKEAELTTTLEDNHKFLAQCVRWRRTTWRSNFTSLFIEGVIWRDQPYSTYALHLSSFNPPALIMDPLLAYLLYQSIATAGPASHFPGITTSLSLFFLWLVFTKMVKFVDYFRQYPADLKFLPLVYAFSYLHGLIYFYTLLTLHKTSWGGGRTVFVSGCEKLGAGPFSSLGSKTPNDDLEAGYTGLESTESSGTDLHLLGEKMKRGGRRTTGLAMTGLPKFEHARSWPTDHKLLEENHGSTDEHNDL
ncbi:MAG: hypothetical protein Q9166_007688 [cf. Caloplaca sp. 2 TL-2023]